MEDRYDAIVLGTGMTECVLSGLLSMEGLKVLHVDRNAYYGGECASLNLEQLFQKFDRGAPPAALGRSNHYNVDLTPKLLLANGILVKILRKTVAERYSMEFMVVEGSYLVKGGKIHKVPSTDKEALKSDLMSLFEKRRCAQFLGYVQAYDEAVPKTHHGKDLRRVPFSALVKEYGLQEGTVDFLGTAVALELTQDFLHMPALPTVMKLKLYEESASIYGKSPYVYPLYGLSDIPQAFARLCAVHGGTYMLNKPVDKVLFDEAGKFQGIQSGSEIAHARFVVGDPSYFPDRVEQKGQTVRAICLLDHPVAGVHDGAKSCQIIIPGKETGRKSDMYVVVLSGVHKVVPDGFFLAIVSATVESADPAVDLQHGLKLLGAIRERFVFVSPWLVPKDDGVASQCFVSQSLDATSHFESCCDDILSLYRRITGRPYDVDAPAPPPPGEAAAAAAAAQAK